MKPATNSLGAFLAFNLGVLGLVSQEYDTMF